MHDAEWSIYGPGLPSANKNHHDTWNTAKDLCLFVSNQETFAIKSCAQRSGAFNYKIQLNLNFQVGCYPTIFLWPMASITILYRLQDMFLKRSSIKGAKWMKNVHICTYVVGDMPSVGQFAVWWIDTEIIQIDMKRFPFGSCKMMEIACNRIDILTSNDAHHEKTDLEVFVVVIPKEGWARVAAPILLLVWHQLFKNMIYEVEIYMDYILEKSESWQKKDGCGQARPSFFWYYNDKDLKVCFLMKRII